MVMNLDRLIYRYKWRIRYWWMDSREGRIARVSMALLVAVGVLSLGLVHWLAPTQPEQPQEAIIWWLVYLIVMIVAAAVSYMMMPKPESPDPAKADPPSTDDGVYVKHHFGTCWVSDQFILAWKKVGQDPIKVKGGKK